MDGAHLRGDETLYNEGAVLLSSSIPTVLPHSGLSTTDMPFTAAFTALAAASFAFLDRAALTRGILLGAALGKFSLVVFLPACLLAWLVACLGARLPAWKQAARVASRRAGRSRAGRGHRDRDRVGRLSLFLRQA